MLMINSNMVLNNFKKIPIWSTFLAFATSISWLMPHHYYPWLAMHSDAWISASFIIFSFYCLTKYKSIFDWSLISVITSITALLPWINLNMDLPQIHGNSGIVSAYLLGFLLAQLVGAYSETRSPRQLLDSLFIAIVLATFISVGLQLQQWLQTESSAIWTMGGSPVRPHANLGQPNQLATLLLWGVLAAGWYWVRGTLSATTSIFMACFLLFGLALTGSRTAWLAVMFLLAAAWAWRRHWRTALAPWAFTALAGYFALCVAFVAWATPFLISNNTLPSSVLATNSTAHRWHAWILFFDAIAQRPWFGYGWNQTALAQMEVAIHHPNLGGVFSFAHNLFLDLIIWCGIPLGLAFIFFIIYWMWRNLRAVNNAENAILMMLLLVVVNHAMLEMPLYYAYFLLPVGFVIGALNVRHRAKVIFSTGRGPVVALWFVCTLLLGLIIKDYLEVEENHKYLRYEQMRIKVKAMDPPDVILLTQWHDQIELARFEPTTNMAPARLKQMQDIVGVYPSALFAHKMATALALNHDPDGARLWLQRLCKISPEDQCKSAEIIWAKQALKHPGIAAIAWPVNTHSSGK